MLHSLEREKLSAAWFATITYPSVFPAPDDHAVYKGHLHRLCQELRRREDQPLDAHPEPKVSGDLPGADGTGAQCKVSSMPLDRTLWQ
jgi:hypothetical protein